MKTLLLHIALLSITTLAFGQATPSGPTGTPTLVQHVLCPNSQDVDGTVPNSSKAYKCPWPSLAGSGNTNLVVVTATGSRTFTVSDDASGDSFSLLESLYDSTNDQTLAIYCATGIIGGSANNYIQPSSISTYMQVDQYEFQYASCSLDGTPTANTGTTGTSMTAGSITTTSGGDLIFQSAYNDGSGSFSSVSGGPSPWVLESVDLIGGVAGQYQVQPTAGSINPTFTQGISSRYISIGVALQASTAGTMPNPFRIVSLEHLNNANVTSATITAQCPIHGNLMVLDWSSDGPNTLNSVSDGVNTISRIGNNVLFPNGNGVVSRFYAHNISPNGNETLTLHQSAGIGHGNTLFCYDIAGADSSPLDLAFGGANNGLASGTGTQATGSGGNVTIFTATPSQANEIVIVDGGQDYDTSTGLGSPTGAIFQSALYTGEPEPTVFDENNFFADYYAPTSAPQTWTMVHNTQDSTGVGDWAAAGSAFQSASGSAPAAPTGLTAVIQ